MCLRSVAFVILQIITGSVFLKGSCQAGSGGAKLIFTTENEFTDLQQLLQEIMVKTLPLFKCVAIISDEIYQSTFTDIFYRRFGSFISFIIVNVADYEDLLAPSSEIQNALILAKSYDCPLHIILLSNGLQVRRLLKFGDKYRVLNTRSNFVFLYDNRLFEKSLFYIWRRIINVIFLREYGGKKGKSQRFPWFELSTVPFPSTINNILVPRRLDIWAQSKFRYGSIDLFRDKTTDLRNQTMKVIFFPHVPGTVKIREHGNNNTNNGTFKYGGIEVEILETVAKAMNFHCDIYEASNVDGELWGQRLSGRIYSGLIGEMVNFKADIALGDLYYTDYLLDLMDLSIPYNTECLTFLTPEALFDNNWKTLILPFTSLMWGCIIICLLICGGVFYALARFHQSFSTTPPTIQSPKNHNKSKRIVTLNLNPNVDKMDSNEKYARMKELYQSQKYDRQPNGLYQFSKPANSFLYTYSMLLLVSLPKLPTGWSLRMLTGWYWIYCLLLVVAYRASMTAILSRPPSRVTIDTLQELIDSRLPCGGWGEVNQKFFESVQDPSIRMIGSYFQMVNDTAEAVERVTQGSFAFYENTYFLQEALVKRKTGPKIKKRYNSTDNRTHQINHGGAFERGLHIMSHCVIKMPISIGLQKNSPITQRMNKLIRRVLEAGLIKKWLDDVIATVLTDEIQAQKEGIKALMNMKKFVGALVALFVGYFVSIVALLIEIFYFHLFYKKNPNFNPYLKTVDSHDQRSQNKKKH